MSSENAQLGYVEEQVNREIDLYTKRKRFNRKAAFLFTVVPATLAALATVFIGASEILDSRWLPILAMVATGAASILSTWEALFANKKLWRVNNRALTDLYELKSDMEYRMKAQDSPLELREADEYFERLKRVRAKGERGYQRAMGEEV
ncbi:MAG: DUF4231 domain-containing protein [Acidobacteriota bacterium]|nr:DUF4231 domain-containing protein [Acidobacteriota bacterium]